MILHCISSSSAGNCYTLILNNSQTLILDCGVSIFKIMQGVNFNWKSVIGCIVSHNHSDHIKAKSELEKLHIPLWLPFEEETPKIKRLGDFLIQCFPLPHNGIPNYGFLIKANGQTLIYMTDFEYCPFTFKKQQIQHFLIECNYCKGLVDSDSPNFEHKVLGHAELGTVKEFIKINNSPALRTVILCHLGAGADYKQMKSEIKTVVDEDVIVDIATTTNVWELSPTPF